MEAGAKKVKIGFLKHLLTVELKEQNADSLD